MGIPSRREATVSHRHITVNGDVVNNLLPPKPGDKAVRENLNH
jgi:hypothetical protein